MHAFIIPIVTVVVISLLPSSDARPARPSATASQVMDVIQDKSTGGIPMRTTEYFSLRYAYTITTKCYRVCSLAYVFSKEARDQCYAEKDKNCQLLKAYSIKEFVMYHLTHNLGLGVFLDHSQNMANKAGEALKTGTAAGKKALQTAVNANAQAIGTVTDKATQTVETVTDKATKTVETVTDQAAVTVSSVADKVNTTGQGATNLLYQPNSLKPFAIGGKKGRGN